MPSFLNVIISTDIVPSNPSLFFVFCSSFFFLYFFFFSLPLLLAMPHTSHLHVRECSPTSIALLFLQSCLNAHCVLAYIACRRSIGGSFTNFTSLALQLLVFRQLSAELESGFIIWPTGVNCTLSLRAVPFSASLSTLIPLETGALTLQVAGAKKKYTDGTAPMALHRLSGSD